MNHKKILTYEQVKKERQFAKELEKCGVKKFFIFTNGCFDLFHAGHASLLNSMKNCCTLNSKLSPSRGRVGLFYQLSREHIQWLVMRQWIMCLSLILKR